MADVSNTSEPFSRSAKEFSEEGGQTIHKCIRYTDLSLRRFFETASRQPWFNNTIFVFTSDHTNQTSHKEYQTDLGFFGAPILFFDPSGEMPRGRLWSLNMIK